MKIATQAAAPAVAILLSLYPRVLWVITRVSLLYDQIY